MKRLFGIMGVLLVFALMATSAVAQTQEPAAPAVDQRDQREDSAEANATAEDAIFPSGKPYPYSFGTPTPASIFPSPRPSAALPPQASSANGWQFALTPYIWFAGFDANATILGQKVSGSAGFLDIWDELNFGFMQNFEARKGRWGIGSDLMYMNLDNLETFTAPSPFSAFRISQGMFMLGPQVSFRLAESNKGFFDFITGFRYWHVNLKLDTSAGILPAFSREQSVNFVNPLVGGRFRVNLGKGWFVPVTGDIGGFGAGSDLAWHAFGGLGKDIKPNMSLLIGYRAMGLDEKPIDELTFHGLVIGATMRFGGPKPTPPPANRAPSMSCAATPASVYAGSGAPVTVRANASDSDNDSLTYAWSTTGGNVSGSGAEAQWDSSGVPVGSYRVSAQVNDGKGGAATCETEIRVEPKPNTAPTVTCAAERSSVLVGERVRINASASDADNDSLTYGWRTSGGQVVGSGATVQLDTTGLAAGNYTVTGRVEDGRGGAADCSASLGVTEPPPPPQASKLNECLFRTGTARTDNVCKRILDDVALRLQNDPRSSVVVIGYADPGERGAAKLGASRASEVTKYLAEKGIADARMQSRTGSGQAGAGKQNQRADIVLVPEGATY